MRFEKIALGQAVILNGRTITAFPANHVIPAVGYHLDSGETSLVFSGDTSSQDTFWEVVNRIDNLGYLIIETAFHNAEKELAVLSGHLCPDLLAEELEKLQLRPKIYISHLKPGESELTMREISECVQGHTPGMLVNGQVFEF